MPQPRHPLASPSPSTPRPSYRDALERSGAIPLLAGYDPHVVGTLPLGLARPESDIDIVCEAPDLALFAADVWERFGAAEEFALRQWCSGERPVVATFVAEGWPFEIFASRQPVRDQPGWRHFDVERRLLDLGRAPLRAAVMAARNEGLKTEPAFGRVLGLAGDPFLALLELQTWTDDALARHLATLGLTGAD
jgi:hypothetical protein